MTGWKDTIVALAVALVAVGAVAMFAVLAWAIITGRLTS